MPMISVYIDDRGLAELETVSRETGRSVEDLAEAAVADAACRSESERRAREARNQKEMNLA